MPANSYAGIIEANVARLIVSRARRLSIPANEIDDLQQQIVPVLAEFEFDASRSNGASFSTVMTAVIDRQLKAHLRAKRRYDTCLQRMHSASRTHLNSRPIWPNHVAQPEPIDLKLDLEKAMAGLSDRDRKICHGLSHGLTQKAIAKQLGIGRDTVASTLPRIRRVFTAAGLKVWIDPEYQERSVER